MTTAAAQGAGTFTQARARGVARAAGAYAFALLLLVALGWLVRPEAALLTSALQYTLAIGGLALAALLAWLFPVAAGAPGHARHDPGPVLAPPLSDTAQASIAVLPLDNLSGASDDALVAQGFAAEIVRALSGVPDLRVVPSLQSAAFAGRRLAEVATELNVPTTSTLPAGQASSTGWTSMGSVGSSRYRRKLRRRVGLRGRLYMYRRARRSK